MTTVALSMIVRDAAASLAALSLASSNPSSTAEARNGGLPPRGLSSSRPGPSVIDRRSAGNNNRRFQTHLDPE